MRFSTREKTFSIAIVVMLTFLFALRAMNATTQPAGAAQRIGPLRLVQTVPLPGVKGRIDHMALDTAGQRLFIAALGNNTLEIVDLQSGRRIHSISGLHEPQDISYVAEAGRIFVSNGGNGSLSIFNGRSLDFVGNINFHEDADNLRYDSESKYLYVGYGNGAIGILDTKSGKITGDIGLTGHPEAFQLESAGPRIFVNIPSARQVAVVDRAKRSVTAVWPLKASGNFPLALDEKRHRLFVGCRQPAKILIYDTESGKEVSEVDIGLDVDDIFFDDANRQLYASCGEGFVDVIHQIDADHYEVTARMKTAKGARTARFVPDQMKLYLAVPSQPEKGAQIRVYTSLKK